MATSTDVRSAFPKIPEKTWWELRRRLKNSVPQELAPNYLETVLRLSAASANTYIKHLRTIGLIDDDNKPLERLYDWREDDTYGKACSAIANEVYPDELRSVCPLDSPDKEAATRWFSRTTKAGTEAVRQMASFYLVLCAADPTGGQAAGVQAGAKTPSRIPKKRLRDKAGDGNGSDSLEPSGNDDRRLNPPGKGTRPSIHLDVQIHISPEASSEQIECLFAAMAKYLRSEEQ